MYAVVSTGGKQYRVEAGATLLVERLAADPGSTVTLDRVLLVGDGERITVGDPTVQGVSVSATVLGEELGPKIVVFKFKQKVKYRRRTGHRQHLTRLRIDGISGVNGSSPEAKLAEPSEPTARDAESAPQVPTPPARKRTRRTATPKE